MNMLCFSIGSNMEPREHYLKMAVQGIQSFASLDQEHASPYSGPMPKTVFCSQVYETPPWGPVPQGPFYNLCCGLFTSQPATVWLSRIQQLEQQAGRQRDIKWGPRTLDIDLVVYGNFVLKSPELTLPHPFMQDRAFVLVPLAELCSAMSQSWTHPILGRSITELLGKLPIDELEQVTPIGPIHY